MAPPKFRIALSRGGQRVEQSRLDYERDQQKHRFAAEVWDAKGLAVPTLGYDALTRGGRKRGATPAVGSGGVVVWRL